MFGSKLTGANQRERDGKGAGLGTDGVGQGPFWLSGAVFSYLYPSTQILGITSTLYAYEDGTDRKFRNVGTKSSDPGRLIKNTIRHSTNCESLKSRLIILFYKNVVEMATSLA